MTRSAVASRLPGVFFLEPPRVAPPVLPPLDVTAFVGFAERGPLDLPVPLDDVTQYADVFGGELPLARSELGQTVSAYLPAAVRSFFANGGRRCYVGRVAGRAATAARFALPGVVALDGLGFPRLALVDAASEGRWANALRLATQLSVLPLPRDAFEIGATGLRWWAGSDASAIQRGDILRLTDNSGDQWLAPVADVQRPASTAEPVGLQATGAFALVQVDASPPVSLGAVSRLDVGGPRLLDLTGSIHRDGEHTVLDLQGPDITLLRPGDLLVLDLPDGEALFHLSELRQLRATGSPPEPRAEARGSRLLRLPAVPLPSFSPPDVERIERLRFDLLLQPGETRRLLVTNLSFSQGGPRFWGDAVLLESSMAGELPPRGGRNGQSAGDRGGASRLAGAQRLAGAAHAAAAAQAFRALKQGRHLDGRERQSLDRIALGGLLAPTDDAAPNPSVGSPAEYTYLPLDVPSLLAPDDVRGPVQTGDDDLADFTAAPFLDDELRNVSTGSLLTDAWDLAYVRERRLRGLHSLMTVDEVALVAVPDAVHRPWATATSPPTPEPELPLPVPPVEEPCPNLVSSFLACARPPTIESVEPAFGDADDRLGAALTATVRTVVTLSGSGFEAGPLVVRFGGRVADSIIVESDTRLTCLTPLRGIAGPVDVEVENRHGTAVLPGGFVYVAASSVPSLPLLLPLAVAGVDLTDMPLLELHEAVLRICQARRDLVGLLSLPAHFERQHCLAWQDAFRDRLGLPRRGLASDLADLADLSFVAVYHPWLLLADGTAPERTRLVPPDGAVAGTIAARERRRGVWVAPANVPLHAALTVVPSLRRDDWVALFEAQINVVRREARDVRVMSAHTLSDEHDLLQLSVRRLMILLRKAAIERGMDFVFESNHERFREGVAVMLRGMLRGLFERGAFAGATPERSYRVVTDASVNPRQSVDQGRFVAQIQVAPSQPAELITVTLTRSDEGALLVHEV